ncbi:MAG: winged helix DNA-binding protein [Nannocystaceae bacterium]
MTTPDPDTLARARAASVLQLAMRLGRLADEEAVRRVAAAGGPAAGLRTAHTRLFPHVALEGTRPSEIARRLGVSKQAVGPLIDELCAMGVFERVPDPDDRRAVRVRWSDRGRQAMLHGLGVLGGLERELAEALGDGGMAALRELLVRALERADAWGDGGG